MPPDALPPADLPRRLERRTLCESQWVNHYVDRVLFPGGRLIEEHHFLDFQRPAVAVLVEREGGDLLLVHVYRYLTGGVEWEIPGGVVDDGESILNAARREVAEEAGVESTDHRLLYTFHPMNGITNQVFHVAHCRVGRALGEIDRNEVREARWFTREELVSRLRTGEVRDGFTLTALLLHFSEIQAHPDA